MYPASIFISIATGLRVASNAGHYQAAHGCYPPCMKQWISAGIVALFLPIAGCHAGQPASSMAQPSPRMGRVSRIPSRSTAPGFDFYLLNLSWSPEYCYSHPNATECAAHATFVLHGLWPERADGSYPAHCSDAPGPVDPSRYRDVYPDPRLLRHEWYTHGTCSGLSPNAYFTAARTAFHAITIPATLNGLTTQISLPPERILQLVAASNPSIPRKSLALSCGRNFLTAVEI